MSGVFMLKVPPIKEIPLAITNRLAIGLIATKSGGEILGWFAFEMMFVYVVDKRVLLESTLVLFYSISIVCILFAS